MLWTLYLCIRLIMSSNIQFKLICRFDTVLKYTVSQKIRFNDKREDGGGEFGS
jgi:hypothetical protein